MLLMLRNRSREVASKQPRNSMADHPIFLPSPKQNQANPISSFLGSPRFFNGFLTRTLSDSESQSSPTSILDSKNSFGYYDKKLLILSNNNNNTCLENGNKHIYEKIDGIGLALLDSLINDENFKKSNNSKMVLFGAKKLKLQIPSSPSLDDSTPKSPADFGIKTRNSQFLSNSLSASFGSPNSSSVKFSKSLSFSEMELSEEYTCVITHGPNPKTTHIFDDCIVESCCGVGSLCELKKEYGISLSTHSLNSVPVSFLRFCYTCKNQLGDGEDIYMYRGEKAFCSHECRCQEMLIEEEVKNPKPDEFSMA